MIAAREITVTTLGHLTSSSNQNDSNLSNDCPPDRKSSTVVAVQEWIPKNSQLGYNVTTVDLSERFVILTKERVQTATVKKMDMRHLDFPQASFDGLWASFSLLHIRASDIEQTLSGFRTVLRPHGLLFAAVHRGPKTEWVKTTISGMERDTYVQEWVQTEIEDIFRSSGFTILVSRPFVRSGGRYPLLSILARA